jgi:hypothetical protein
LLGSLLNSSDDDEEGLALDRILHGQWVIGRTGPGRNQMHFSGLLLTTSAEIARTTEIESLRFSDGDLVVLGTLDHGQFGMVSA